MDRVWSGVALRQDLLLEFLNVRYAKSVSVPQCSFTVGDELGSLTKIHVLLYAFDAGMSLLSLLDLFH